MVCGVSERVAVYLDLENLLHPFREAKVLATGIGTLLHLIWSYERTATVITKIAVCNRTLQRLTAFELGLAGVRVFGHSEPCEGAADALLIAHLETALPASTTTVVIGSGDHIFASATLSLKAKGRQVHVFAPVGGLALELASIADSVMTIGPDLGLGSLGVGPKTVVAA